MHSRISLLAVFLLSASLMTAQAEVFVEDWDDPSNENHDWKYWVAGSNTDTRPAVDGQNQDMNWSATGGVSDSGYVWSPGSEWFPTWDRLWPAYMAPPDPVAAINLAGQTLSISVNDFGTVAALPTQLEVPLHLFIGEWNVNSTGSEDDEYVFFQHNATITVGNDEWAHTSFEVGDDGNWSDILRSDGNTKTPSDLYADPQQWGFVIDLASVPSSIRLGFDGLGAVPEPSGFVLMSLALIGAALWGWRRRRTV